MCAVSFWITQYAWDNARRGVHYQVLMDHAEALEVSDNHNLPAHVLTAERTI